MQKTMELVQRSRYPNDGHQMIGELEEEQQMMTMMGLEMEGEKE
jgi:hypothetical protein